MIALKLDDAEMRLRALGGRVSEDVWLVIRTVAEDLADIKAVALGLETTAVIAAAMPAAEAKPEQQLQ